MFSSEFKFIKLYSNVSYSTFSEPMKTSKYSYIKCQLIYSMKSKVEFSFPTLGTPLFAFPFIGNSSILINISFPLTEDSLVDLVSKSRNGSKSNQSSQFSLTFHRNSLSDMIIFYDDSDTTLVITQIE